ncbi:MAG: hypothetical protein RR048_05670 [Oscillospiraceae bacterium]
MPNYKELYFKLFRATEKAIRLLTTAQQECEELYLNQPEIDLKVLSISTENNKSTEEE